MMIKKMNENNERMIKIMENNNKNNSHDSLRLYFFDRELPMAGKLSGFGWGCIIVTIICVLCVVQMNQSNRGYSVYSVYDPLFVVVATITFWVGIIFLYMAASVKEIGRKAFFAVRDERVYLISISSNKINTPNHIELTKIDKLIHSIQDMQAAQYYAQLAAEAIASNELYENVNDWLDKGNSELFVIDDLVTTKRFSPSEKKALLKEYERLVG